MGDWLWILSPVGAIMWRLGGSIWKGFRRYIWPLAMLILIGKFTLWRPIAGTLGLMLAHHLPYGENTPIWLKCLTALMFSAPFFLFGAWGAISISILFLLSFWLSHKYNWFTWAWVEMLTGAGQGAVICLLYFHSF